MILEGIVHSESKAGFLSVHENKNLKQSLKGFFKELLKEFLMEFVDGFPKKRSREGLLKKFLEDFMK